MMFSVKLSQLTAHNDIPQSTYHNCLAQMVCNLPQPGCYLGTCYFCPSTTRLRYGPFTVMDDNMMDSTVFKQWVSVDRYILKQSLCQLMTVWNHSEKTWNFFFYNLSYQCSKPCPTRIKGQCTTCGAIGHCRLLRKLLIYPPRCSTSITLE